MSSARTRNLIYRLWDLPMSKRRELAERLGLIEPGDLALPEWQLYDRVLRRASQKGLIDDVRREIELVGG